MQAARLMLVVVFPQPPFWLMIAMIRMANLPWFTRCPTRHVYEKRPAPRGGVPSVGFPAPSPMRPPEPPAGLLVQIGEWCVKTLGLWDREAGETVGCERRHWRVEGRSQNSVA